MGFLGRDYLFQNTSINENSLFNFKLLRGRISRRRLKGKILSFCLEIREGTFTELMKLRFWWNNFILFQTKTTGNIMIQLWWGLEYRFIIILEIFIKHFWGYLSLSLPNIVKSYFWTLYTPGWCNQLKYSIWKRKISVVDKIYIKPVLRYQGNHHKDFFTWLTNQKKFEVKESPNYHNRFIDGCLSICLSTNSSIFSQTQSYLIRNT